MRRSSILFNLLGAVGLVGLLSGCGGDGGGAPSSPGTGSASGSAATSGTITGFGSLYVNGKKFETNDVEVIHDGQSARCSISPTTHCGFKEGMTVKVTGSFSGDQRSASTVQQKDAVEGLVQSIAPDGLSLVVMGQRVQVDNTTLIDDNIDSNPLIPNRNIRNLVAGDFAEVNGHIRPDGVIQATFIEKKFPGTVTPEVRGFVKNHNDAAKTFQLGNLTVNYTTALINDMPSSVGNVWNGLFIEAKGTQFTPGPNVQTQGMLVATKVEPENQGVQQADEFEVEGFVTQVMGPGDFFIGTTRVKTTASTEFRGGTINEIVVGAKLSAEGRLASGLLTAKHVKFHASVKLEGNIAAINGNTITIAGLPTVTVTVNSQTEIEADSGSTMSSLSVGVHVRVRGRVGGANSVIATRVEQRSAADTDVELQGPVRSISGSALTILGVSVDTSSIRNDNFEGLNDQVIGRAAFLNAVKEGTLVKVKGQLVGEVINWEEAELED